MAGEGLVGFHALSTYAQNFSTQLCQFLIAVSETAGFFCAADCFVFWIKIENYVLFAQEFRERHVVAHLGGKREIRCFVADFSCQKIHQVIVAFVGYYSFCRPD